MFHMMNEARIGVGMAATMLAWPGYYASLDYAKNRPRAARSRASAGKGRQPPGAALIEHADIKRMLLAQKAYGEGARVEPVLRALCWSTSSTAARQAADEAACCWRCSPRSPELAQRVVPGTNSPAIQIHGGYGYTRDFPVEQYWRDNRLNMIHEGTHGIQAMGLLGRKVLMEGGKGMALLAGRINGTVQRALTGAGPGRTCQRGLAPCSRWVPPPKPPGPRANLR